MEPAGVHENERELLIEYYIQKVSGRLRRLKNPDINDRKRWIWELLQNAKDSIARSEKQSVDIEVEVNDEKVIFRHNGEPFSLKAMSSLIWQKSGDKRGVEGSSGRFGTGFLTTHTLSETVNIKSNLKDANGRVFGLEFTLFRDGETDGELQEGIERTLASRKYDPNNINQWTEFTYMLKTAVNQDCAKEGIHSLEKNIFYNLAFTPEINSIRILSSQYVRHISRLEVSNLDKRISRLDFLDNFVGDGQVVSIAKIELRAPSRMLTNKFKKDREATVSAAIEIDVKNKRIVGLDENTPSIFCVFPLIGSEKFCFPVVLNSIDFEPEPEREHLLLDGEIYGENELITTSGINKVLISYGVFMYQKFLRYFSAENYSGMHYLAVGANYLPSQKRDFDNKWYKEIIQKKIREIILSVPIVETADGLKMIKTEKETIYFPKSDDEILQDIIWEKAFDIMSASLPLKEICANWSELAWEDDCKLLTLNVLIEEVAKYEELSALPETLNDKIGWIDELLLVAKDHIPNELEQIAIIPTMDGKFRTSNHEDLSISDGLPKEAIDMLLLFDEDWRAILVVKGILNSPVLAKKNEQQFVAKLNGLIKSQSQPSKPEFLKAVCTLISYIPKENDITGLLTESRIEIYEMCVGIFGDLVPLKIEIAYADKDFWEQADIYLAQQFVAVLENLNLVEEEASPVFDESAEDAPEDKHVQISPLERLRVLLSQNMGMQKNEQFVLNWLNRFYKFMQGRGYAIGATVPNQNGVFNKLESLMGDLDIPDALKKIMLLISPKEDYKEILIHGGLEILPTHSKSVRDIAKSIDDVIKVTEKENADSEFLEGIKLLVVDWFNSPNYPNNLFDQYRNDNNREASSDYFSRNYFEHAWARRDSLEISLLWTVDERRDFQKLRKVIPEELRRQLLEDPDLLNLHKELLKENQKLVQQLVESKALLDKYPDISVQKVDMLMRIYELSIGWDTSIDYTPDEEQIRTNFENGWKGEAYVYKQLITSGFNVYWPNKSIATTFNVIVDYTGETHYIEDKGQAYDLVVTLTSGNKVYIQVKTTSTDISRADEIALPISTREWMFIGEKQIGEYFFLARVFNIYNSPELYFMKLNQMDEFMALEDIIGVK